MQNPPPASRLPDGSLVLPPDTARFLQEALARFTAEFAGMHGRELSDEAMEESHEQTAQRQDFVDQLSASIGVVPPTVQARDMPTTHQLADSAPALQLLQALERLLFPPPGA